MHRPSDPNKRQAAHEQSGGDVANHFPRRERRIANGLRKAVRYWRKRLSWAALFVALIGLVGEVTVSLVTDGFKHLALLVFPRPSRPTTIEAKAAKDAADELSLAIGSRWQATYTLLGMMDQGVPSVENELNALNSAMNTFAGVRDKATTTLDVRLNKYPDYRSIAASWQTLCASLVTNTDSLRTYATMYNAGQSSSPVIKRYLSLFNEFRTDHLSLVTRTTDALAPLIQ